jgi:hypothetical protein
VQRDPPLQKAGSPGLFQLIGCLSTHSKYAQRFSSDSNWVSASATGPAS